jgi:hypothetical protein
MTTQSLSQRTAGKRKRRERSGRQPSQIKVAVAMNHRFVRARSPHVSRPSIARRHAVDILVNSFVRQLRYLPANARLLVSREELPSGLLNRVRSLGRQSSWHAWTDHVRFWFIAAQLRNSRDASTGLLNLKISFFDSDGRRVAAGEWTLQSDGAWTLRRVMNTPIVPPHTATAIHENPE